MCLSSIVRTSRLAFLTALIAGGLPILLAPQPVAAAPVADCTPTTGYSFSIESCCACDVIATIGCREAICNEGEETNVASDSTLRAFGNGPSWFGPFVHRNRDEAPKSVAQSLAI